MFHRLIEHYTTASNLVFDSHQINIGDEDIATDYDAELDDNRSNIITVKYRGS